MENEQAAGRAQDPQSFMPERANGSPSAMTAEQREEKRDPAKMDEDGQHHQGSGDRKFQRQVHEDRFHARALSGHP
jgi:hypothetical protein